MKHTQSQISAFKEFLSMKKVSKILFLTENQKWHSEDPCILDLTFREISVFENPNIILLKNGDSSLCLRKIQNIEYSETATLLGILITVVCTYAGCDRDREYNLIAVS